MRLRLRSMVESMRRQQAQARQAAAFTPRRTTPAFQPADRRRTILGRADYVDLWLGLEQGAYAFADDSVVVYQQHTDRGWHRHRGTSMFIVVP